VSVDVLVNLISYKGKCYIGTISGLIFDQGLHDETLTSVHIIDNFVGKYDMSIHKCGLPPSRGDVNYRRNFLVSGGFDTDTNLEDLTYAKFMSCSPHVGSIDIANFTFGTEKILRRFPMYFINYEDSSSNAAEFKIDISLKMEELIESLSAVKFKFNLKKGGLANREVVYRFHRSEIDVTNHKESKEYRQMRLLVGCTAAIKGKQSKYKSVEVSPVKKEADKEESSVPVTPKVSYKNSVFPITPTISNETNLLSSMQVDSADVKKSEDILVHDEDLKKSAALLNTEEKTKEEDCTENLKKKSKKK